MAGALATAKILTKVLQECFLNCFLLIGVYPKNYFFEQKGEFFFYFSSKNYPFTAFKIVEFIFGTWLETF